MNPNVRLLAGSFLIPFVISGCGGGGDGSSDSNGSVTMGVRCARLAGGSYGGAQISSASLLTGAVNTTPVEFCSITGLIGLKHRLNFACRRSGPSAMFTSAAATRTVYFRV